MATSETEPAIVHQAPASPGGWLAIALAPGTQQDRLLRPGRGSSSAGRREGLAPRAEGAGAPCPAQPCTPRSSSRACGGRGALPGWTQARVCAQCLIRTLPRGEYMGSHRPSKWGSHFPVAGPPSSACSPGQGTRVGLRRPQSQARCGWGVARAAGQADQLFLRLFFLFRKRESQTL